MKVITNKLSLQKVTDSLNTHHNFSFLFESWNFYLWSIYFSVQNFDEETVVKRVCLEEDVNF